MRTPDQVGPLPDVVGPGVPGGRGISEVPDRKLSEKTEASLCEEDRCYQIHGYCKPGFEPVREMFQENFAGKREQGSQLCAYYKGEKVVDLWGFMDWERKKIGPDTLLTVFSSSKSLTAVALAMAVDRGYLRYDQTIAEIWPEFGCEGKETARVEDLMRHELGLPTFSTSLKQEDLLPENIKQNNIGRIIEKEVPKTEPGTKREYHAFTRGWIANEIFRRVEPEGRTIGEFLRSEVCEKLGADAYIGLPAHLEERTADLTFRSPLNVLRERLLSDSKDIPSLTQLLRIIGGAIYFGLTSKEPTPPPPIQGISAIRLDLLVNFLNTQRRGEIPSANANCSARGLAKIGAAMANKGSLDDVKILGGRAWEDMHSKPTTKLLFGALSTSFTRGGLNIISPGPDAPGEMKELAGFVGWMGLGGSVFQWHPHKQVGFAYVPSMLDWTDIANKKGTDLQRCLVRCIQDQEKTMGNL